MMLNTGRTKRARLAAVSVLTTAALALAACSPSGDSGTSESGTTESFEFTFASTNNENAAATRTVHEWMSIVQENASEAGYEVEFDEYLSGSLLQAAEIIPGITEGVADTGVFAAFYSPSEFPLAQLNGVPFLAANPVAAAMTHAQMYEENDAYRAEFDKQNIVPVLWDSLPNTTVGFTEPVETLEDFRGKKIRANGLTANALEALGAVPVSLPVNELFEGLERGVVDGFSSISFDGSVHSVSLHEVAPYYVDPQLGQYIQQAAMAFNKDVWDGLPEDLQQIMLDAADEIYSDFAPDTVLGDGISACEMVKEAGGSVIEPSEEEIADWKDLLGDSLQESWVDSVVAAGSSEDDARSYLADFQAAYADIEPNVPPTNAMADCAKG